jgi:hypothetical protein
MNITNMSSSGFRVERLSEATYSVWVQQMEGMLRNMGLWDAIAAKKLTDEQVSKDLDGRARGQIINQLTPTHG